MKQRLPGLRQLPAMRGFRLIELLPWATAVAVYILLPDYLSLATQIVIMIMFALSLDLLLGYTGIVTLGHAAYFGTGAYAAGILAHAGWSEPFSGLVVGTFAAALVGFLTGAVILRTRRLALLMLGMAVTLILHEAANHFAALTGGADGLQGIVIDPIFGRFDFDLYGKTGFVYAVLALFVIWLLARQLVRAPFGRSLVGIRENATRMTAIGVAVGRRRVAIFTIAAAIAGLAGALLVILVLGGTGRLYGAFLGAPIYYVAQDALAKSDPVFWLFWLGLLLVCIVMFARGGLLGIVDTLRHRASRFGLPTHLFRRGAP
jgi:branched-chain amino acid transport system permease protein